MGVELFNADEQTDKTKLIIVFAILLIIIFINYN